ncbi:MAG: hypothetical protein ACKV19_06110 [Verrucomicrobiales bacterium]
MTAKVMERALLRSIDAYESKRTQRETRVGRGGDAPSGGRDAPPYPGPTFPIQEGVAIGPRSFRADY